MSKTVKLKFSVQQVSLFTYGEVIGFKHVVSPIVKKGEKKPDNAKYHEICPAATLEMQINKEAKEYGSFQPGDEFYVEFTKAN